MKNKAKFIESAPDLREQKIHREEAFLGIICALVLIGVGAFFLLGAEGDYLLETFGLLLTVVYWFKA